MSAFSAANAAISSLGMGGLPVSRSFTVKTTQPILRER
jgi:hypothetical protein